MALGEPDNAARFASGELALDFVNSATGRSRASRWEDSLTDAFATLTWLRQREAVDEEGFRTLLRLAATDDAAAQAFMTDVTALRDTLSTVFRAAVSEDAPPEAALERLGGFFARAHGAERLVWGPKGVQVARDTQGAGLFRALWPIVRSAEALLTSDRMIRVKRCSSSTCEWLFLDTSKNNSRRWCRMDVCGNREKGRRRLVRERVAEGVADGASGRGDAPRRANG